MRSHRALGTSGQPVRFLYEAIEHSDAFPDDVKAHVLQFIRPHTRIYNVTPEQAVASAIALNAYAHAAKWQAIVAKQQTDTGPGMRKYRIAARESRSWASACAKFMRFQGVARKKGYRPERQQEIAKRKKEIPPASPSESESERAPE